MKKITILALHLSYGGIEQYLSSLCKMLENNYDIEIISTYRLSEKPAFEFSDKVKIRYLINRGPNREEIMEAIRSKNLIKILKEGVIATRLLFLKKIRNIRAIRKVDSYYIITTRVFHNKLVSRYAKKSIIKIATEHNFHNNDNKYVNEVICSLKGFSSFVVPSLNLKKYYDKLLGDVKCYYIPNTIDNLPLKRSMINNYNLISIGRLEAEKGQKDLIDVVSVVKRKISDIKLYLIGDGSLRGELKKYIKKLELTDNVIMTGFLSRDKINRYLEDSTLFLLSSYTESFGLVLIEAMSFGVPCIAFDSSDGAKNLLSQGNGILIKNRDKEKMADEIIKLLKDKKKRVEMSDRCYEYSKQFLIDEVCNYWFDLLEGK